MLNKTVLVFSLAVLISIAVLSAPASAAEELGQIVIAEWDSPYAGRTRDPFAAGADEIWYVGQIGAIGVRHQLLLPFEPKAKLNSASSWKPGSRA